MIIKTLRILLTFSCCLLSTMVLAQENSSQSTLIKPAVSENVVIEQVISQQNSIPIQQGLTQQVSSSQELNNDNPEVGRRVMENMDAGSMILSLLMVLALIVICAFVLKRFNLTQQGVSQLKLVTSLSLGAKERVVVIQAGEQQLLLGVTAQQVTLIERLEAPLATQTMKATELPKSMMSFLSAKKS
ncbi:flagellar biosynthetic protein FliO [Colwellia psychrerythraea]|uniref:Flagellar protein n=1 Tax=Colwellia psychrerythraea TaxID=28229 RepID=A0A099KMA4_COLPS|nr:flagellar biosynthetic protein FliO [Colwellia psychrerythraea]KGJ91375.1 flagellar biosynthetic protein FliO [Colwellia psychrerythraea]